MTDLPRKKLIVTAQREVTSGHGDHGDWTLYNVEATTPDGEPIMEVLKTFEVLPHGELIDVTVKAESHERYGPSYTLKLVRQGSRTDEIERRLAAVESRLAHVEAAVSGI